MSSKEKLVQEIIDFGYLKSPQIIKAFLSIDRKDFVTLEHQDEAYLDIPLPIGFGQTISQPLTVAFMLELLNPQKGDKILDIGSGSGWTSALLSYLVSDGGKETEGKVIAIERIPELKEFGEKNAAKYNFVKKDIVKFFCADGAKAISDICSNLDLREGIDKILCSAAVEKVPLEWLKALKTGGRLVTPLDGEIQLWVKKSARDFEKQSFKGFSFVPLISDDGE
ncbi:MAG: protein-L-isoaspartate O-methyltransferase [Candidatus Pacebacteria bacterium]|nr:protein-L-isoaspartate O-methyltransferase [Candidatus Paceibacterota bacterium]